MTKRFVITGCGRSGTTYTAELLTRLGCGCGHEQYFDGRHPTRIRELAVRLGLRPLQWHIPPHGEAAWEAAPLLPLLPEGTPVFHQLRHPLEFIRSRQKKGWVHGRFRHRHLPQIRRYQRTEFGALPLVEQVEVLARFWVGWNRLVEERAGARPYLRYRIEDFDLALLLDMLDRIEFPYDPAQVEMVYRGMPTNTNTRGQKREDITLELLSETTRRELQQAAARYGYRLNIDQRPHI